MDAWDFIHDNLNKSIAVVLLVVLNSEGSSPGRQGFKMAVSAEGSLFGTIGGGIMEQKLAARAKQMIADHISKITVTRQYHDKNHAAGQSGMICSGNQTIAFFPINPHHKNVFDLIISQKPINNKLAVQFSPEGIQIVEAEKQVFFYADENEWHYTEQVFKKPVIHIIGAGHVGLALSEVMKFLGFYIKLYDDRKSLHTWQQNVFADEKNLIDYNHIKETVIFNDNEFVVIMTVGYRTDKLVLKQFLDSEFRYLGLLGSQKKIEKLFAELQLEGSEKHKLDLIHAPVGVSNFSRTANEIAISIAAEIINEKNKNLPTGRNQ